MALRGALEASGDMGTPVDPLRPSCGFQRSITGLFPELPHPVNRALVGQLRHPLAGFRIAVADDQVRMRIVQIRSGLVKSGEPRSAALGKRFRESLHQFLPRELVQFTRQGQHDPVDDAGVLAVGFFLRVQPCPRRVSILRHASGHDDRLGRLAGDVAEMRPCRSGRMGRSANAADVQAVDRYARLASLPPADDPGRNRLADLQGGPKPGPHANAS